MRTPAKTAFTLVELLVVITIIGILVALLLPAVQAAREAGRRIQCCNHLKQIGLALQNYTQTHNRFPCGCIVSVGVSPAFDPWTEASQASPGRHGTSWLLAVLPFLEKANLYNGWDFTKNVADNVAVAQTDVADFYCPSRRSELRSEDSKRMLHSTWTGGGTDYGGCLGAGNGWSNVSDSSDHHKFANSSSEPWDTGPVIGILSPNGKTAFRDIKDGSCNTIVIGELQRLLPDRNASGYARWAKTSQDGWALGGVATLFTTAMKETNGDYQTGGLNNTFFESPGSEHPGGAQFGMADGSVHFFNDSIDKQVFYYLGAMADNNIAQVPQ